MFHGEKAIRKRKILRVGKLVLVSPSDGVMLQSNKAAVKHLIPTYNKERWKVLVAFETYRHSSKGLL